MLIADIYLYLVLGSNSRDGAENYQKEKEQKTIGLRAHLVYFIGSSPTGESISNLLWLLRGTSAGTTKKQRLFFNWAFERNTRGEAFSL